MLELSSFKQALEPLGARCPLGAARLHSELHGRWAQPHLQGHAALGLHECLSVLGLWNVALSRHDRSLLRLALWFSCGVDEGGAAQGAGPAGQALQSLGVAPQWAQVVDALVLASRWGPGPAPGLGRSAAPQAGDRQGAAPLKGNSYGPQRLHDILHDVELAVLGAGAQRLAQHEAGLAQQYAWAPAAAFGAWRLAVLSNYLARASAGPAHAQLYRTSTGQVFTASARRNLSQALQDLKKASLAQASALKPKT